ncbi:MAG: alpha amylase C-terminal domain-containing protein [Clostridia bacterium]|nr:alpha amylase C-terminal domain-containing protein [Clostridia bacterium]
MLRIKQALEKLFAIDPMLEGYRGDLAMHLDRYNRQYKTLTGGRELTDVANGHMYFGFHRTETGWVFREWLPGADAAWLFGDFNGWDRYGCPLQPVGEEGVWELRLEGRDALRHGQYVKLLVGRKGNTFERIPAYIRRATQDPVSHKLCGQIWAPEEAFDWTDGEWKHRRRTAAPLIYEAHVGMAQEKNGIGSYREFADNTLPWIQSMGYNTVQLMAIQEHPYYASFGYQVTNFFAPSHWFGTPEDLKYLVNRAHDMGITVLLDVVHSHACPNEGEGLHNQDGTEEQYFLAGERGWHPAWETRLFHYGRPEVLHFLLSNLKYWMEEFHFDGFRFDGVTSMLYENHGLGVAFTGYDQYYSLNTNVDARVYLMLANRLVHGVDKKAITVAEEMSGMPGMCLPIAKGGFGFDYRLAMGTPDLWIKLIKEQPLESWDVGHLWHELTGGRPAEKTIGYAESHDQAMVGDKTLIFRLADAEMYTGMDKAYHTPSMDTAIDMHKLIRFLTAALSDGGYLNFMGNEFGHPEWIDFPREGNGWSYHHARRQWSLVHNGYLKYEWLANFDRDMVNHVKRRRIHGGTKPRNLWFDYQNNLLIFERAGDIYLFNLHPTKSLDGVFVHCHLTGEGKYKVVFSTDDAAYGGGERIGKRRTYRPEHDMLGFGFKIYLPCRTAIVLRRVGK